MLFTAPRRAVGLIVYVAMRARRLALSFHVGSLRAIKNDRQGAKLWSMLMVKLERNVSKRSCCALELIECRGLSGVSQLQYLLSCLLPQ